MTLPLELGAIADPVVRRAFEQVANAIPVGPATMLGAVQGTTFPTVPVTGQDFYYVADSTNGVVWHFKYRTASASASKWEFVGGPPLYAEVTTTETTASLTYVALATAGPTITVPLAGDYDVEIGGRIFNDTATRGGTMSYDIGGTGAVDTDSINFTVGTGVSAGNIARVKRKTGLAASTALTSKYKATGAGTATFESRWMRVTPVRIT